MQLRGHVALFGAFVGVCKCFDGVLGGAHGESEVGDEGVWRGVSEPDEDVVQLQVPMSYPLAYMQEVQCIDQLLDEGQPHLHGGLLVLNEAE